MPIAHGKSILSFQQPVAKHVDSRLEGRGEVVYQAPTSQASNLRVPLHT